MNDKQDVPVEVMMCHFCAFDILHRMALVGGATLKNHSHMNTITYRKLIITSTRDSSQIGRFLSDKLSSKLNVIAEESSEGVLQGFLIPIINTTFIELSTAAYLRNFFSARLILRLNLLHLRCKSYQSKPIQKSVAAVDED